MSSVMHSFLEKYPVTGCNRLLDKLSPVDIVSLAKFFPIAGISRKKDSIIITYIVNPKSRFRGKAKTRVDVDRTSSTLRLIARGDVSFEVRFNCTNDILTIYFVVTGKLIDMIPRDKAKSIFDEIVNYVRMRAYEIGALRPEEILAGETALEAQPTAPAAAEQQLAETPLAAAETQPPTPLAQPQQPEPAVALQEAQQPTEATGEVQLAEETASLEAAQQPPEETVVQQPEAVQPQPATPAEAGMEGFSVTECIARLITAGLPVDEELSKSVPFNYSPRLSVSPLVEMGEAPVGKLDFTKYRDGYMVRLTAGGTRLDSVRLAGKVGVYMKSDGAGYTGNEAVWRAVNVFCTDPNKKAIYIVVRIQ